MNSMPNHSQNSSALPISINAVPVKHMGRTELYSLCLGDVVFLIGNLIGSMFFRLTLLIFICTSSGLTSVVLLTIPVTSNIIPEGFLGLAWGVLV